MSASLSQTGADKRLTSSNLGIEPHHCLLRRLVAARDSDMRMTAGRDLGSAWSETHNLT